MNKDKRKIVGYLIVLLCASLWGAIGLSVRYVSSLGINTVQSACFRIFVTVITLFVFILITDRNKFKIEVGDIKWFAISGISGILLNNVMYAYSVQYNSLSTAAMLLYLSPFMVMVLARFVLNERLSKEKIIALILCLCGCVMVVGLGLTKDHSLTFMGLIFGVGSAVGYSLYNVYTKSLTQKYDAVTLTFYIFLFACVGLVIFVHPGQMIVRISENSDKVVSAMLGAAITSTLPYFLFPIALKTIESSKASIIATFEVVASSFYGFMLYGEKLLKINIIGIIFIITAVVLLNVELPDKEFVESNQNNLSKVVDNDMAQ